MRFFRFGFGLVLARLGGHLLLHLIADTPDRIRHGEQRSGEERKGEKENGKTTHGRKSYQEMLGKQAASGFDAGQKRMKKVLILTAGYGEGHNTAARNIGAAIEAVSGGAAEARVFDPLDAAYGQLNTWAKKAYLATINHAPALWQYFYGKLDDDTSFQSKLPLMKRLSRTLAAMLDAERPDAVVSTYPLYNYFIESIWAARGEAPPLSRTPSPSTLSGIEPPATPSSPPMRTPRRFS